MLITVTVFTGEVEVDVIAYHFTHQASKQSFFQVDHVLWILQIQLTTYGSLGLLATGLEKGLVIMMVEMGITSHYLRRYTLLDPILIPYV